MTVIGLVPAIPLSSTIVNLPLPHSKLEIKGNVIVTTSE
jgi:hypothetical protein